MDEYNEAKEFQEYFRKNSDPKQVERRLKQTRKALACFDELKKIDVNALLTIAKIGDAIRDARRIIEDLAVFGRKFQKTYETFDFERTANLYDIAQNKHEYACCPSHGAFIAWKVCCTKDYVEKEQPRNWGNVIARVLVHSDSKRGYHNSDGTIVADHTTILDAQKIETGESVDVTELYANGGVHLQTPYYGKTWLGVDKYKLLSWLYPEKATPNELEIKDETAETETI